MTRVHGEARLFVALDLPGGVRGELAAWARQARRGGTQLRLVDAEMLHVTLCFLGDQPLAVVDAIAAVLAECAAPVASLELGAPVWLPPRRPRVLAVELRDGDAALGELQADLARALGEAIGWESERRRFRPHVTVARMREGAAPANRTLAATPALAFAGESLTLYRSWLSPSGAAYEGVSSVTIG